MTKHKSIGAGIFAVVAVCLAFTQTAQCMDGQFVSPQLQTGELVWDIPHEENPKGFWPLPKREKAKFMHRYGYYECRCRLQQMPGWWSAFWMQTPMQGCSLDPRRAGIEHDIMESFEEFVLVTTEAKWYRNNRMTGKGVPELDAAAAAGDDFVVDYVRVYDIVE